MEFFLNMVNLQFMLFILIVIGIIIKRKDIIDERSRKALSNLLINVILPCNIIISFLGDMSVTQSFLKNCIYAVIISFFIQLTATYGSRFIFSKFPVEKKNVMSYGMICSNSSFIGLPVAECIHGSMGVLYTSIFQIPIRFTMWTAGLALFTKVNKKDALKKLAVHPCIIAIFIGFTLMILPIKIPTFLYNSIQAVSRCTVPMSMFVIGTILADADIKTLFSKQILFFTMLRLVIFPLLILAVLNIFNFDSLLVSISIIMSGMPAGSSTCILADKYGCDSMFASQIVFVSTLFSIITIPILTLLV